MFLNYKKIFHRYSQTSFIDQLRLGTPLGLGGPFQITKIGRSHSKIGQK